MKSKGFTFIEVMCALIIISFITLITVYSIKGAVKSADMVGLKSANMSIKNAVNNLLSNRTVYSQDKLFLDISSVELESKYDNEAVEYSGKSKFRMLMFKELEVNSHFPMDCYTMKEDKEIVKSTCFTNEKGVVFGIPDTDFKETGVVEARNASGAISQYTPVTVFPNNKKLSRGDFDANAVVFGIRSDGAVIPIYSVDCEDDKYKNYNQCKIYDVD